MSFVCQGRLLIIKGKEKISVCALPEGDPQMRVLSCRCRAREGLAGAAGVTGPAVWPPSPSRHSSTLWLGTKGHLRPGSRHTPPQESPPHGASRGAPPWATRRPPRLGPPTRPLQQASPAPPRALAPPMSTRSTPSGGSSRMTTAAWRSRGSKFSGGTPSPAP